MCLDNVIGNACAVDGKAVVHGCDLDLAGKKILHRMICPMMSLMHLYSLCSERNRQHLIAEADAEYGHMRAQQLLDHRDCIYSGRCGITRSVREKHPVRIQGHYGGR